MTKENLAKKLFFVAERIHLRVFGHAMSDEMRRFLGHLSWSFLGGIVAAGIMFAVNIVAARWLGPEEFGRYNSILSVASALVFFMLLGSDIGIVRFVSVREKVVSHSHSSFLTVSASLVAFSTMLVLLGYLLLQDIIDSFFGSSAWIAVLFAVSLAWGNLSDSFLRAKGYFSIQWALRVVNSVVAATIFVCGFLLFRDGSANMYALSLIGGYTFFIIASLFLLRKDFGVFSWGNFRKLVHYQKFLVISGVGGMLMGLEKYLLGVFIGISGLGLYSIYYAASFLILSNVGSIFMNAFIPALVRNHESMDTVLDKLKNLFPKIFLLWILADTAMLYFTLRLAGESYHFYFLYSLEFSVASFLAFTFSLVISAMNVNRVNVGTLLSIIVNISIVSSTVLSGSIGRYLFLQTAIYGFFAVFVFFLLRERKTFPLFPL